MNIQHNVPLAPHTYFKLGGPADYFVEVSSKEELIEALHFASDKKVPYFILGSGSNILVTDKGYRGLVIKNKIAGIKLSSLGGKVESGNLGVGSVVLEAGSGVPINQLITYAINHSLAGLEDFLGLPGTVGGAIYNNSHHLDDLIGNHVAAVELLTSSCETVIVPQDKMDFAYDSSGIQKTKDIVISVSFSLKPGKKEELLAKGQFAVKRRATTQPLGLPSSGCIFQNISLSDAMRIGTPNHTLSAGYLIDHAGLKGTRVGGALISDIHANFIVSSNDAKTQDVLDLISLIKDKVKKTYGVDLKEEVFLIGEK